MTLSNAQLSELLAIGAEDHPAGSNKQKAMQRASRSAFYWPEEASALVEAKRPLTELSSVGPWLAGVLLELLTSNDPPIPPDPPPLRDGFLTYSQVRATLDANPEWTRDLRADLQMHTTYSDGRSTLREMAATCADVYGYEFVNITDHSVGLPIANGMDDARLAAEAFDIANLNEELRSNGARLRVLHGLEMNISPEGEGDMKPDVLRRLDLVLGAFHSKLRLKEDQTDRYLAALRNPTFQVLAHPRGRRFNVRLGLRADWRRVFEEALEQGKALEIDAYPDRQDLNVELLRLVADVGCFVSIGTDAHNTSELRFMEFGVAAAILGGIPRERVLNYMPVDELLAWRAERSLKRP